MENTLFNQVFRDNEGRIVIAQFPNLPLTIGILASLFSFYMFWIFISKISKLSLSLNQTLALTLFLGVRYTNYYQLFEPV